MPESLQADYRRETEVAEGPLCDSALHVNRTGALPHSPASESTWPDCGGAARVQPGGDQWRQACTAADSAAVAPDSGRQHLLRSIYSAEPATVGLLLVGAAALIRRRQAWSLQ